MKYELTITEMDEDGEEVVIFTNKDDLINYLLNMVASYTYKYTQLKKVA